jgi:hypothetical protein
LAEAGVTAREVGLFWQAQSFDLELKNIGGKAMDGNCDLCFLKPAHQVFSLIAERPTRAIWWASRETTAKTFAIGDGARFRNDRPGYQQMADYARQQADMFDPDEQTIPCLCGD